MKYNYLTLLLTFLILEGCSSKKEAIDKNIEIVTGNCQTGSFSMVIDGEEFCSMRGEYYPSLSSRYDNEQRDDLLKFWMVFGQINSQKHNNWENISFVGTIADLNKTGDYTFDNSAYNVNKTTNSYSNRTSFIYISKKEDIVMDIHATANQYRIIDSSVRIIKFSKEKISGYYHATVVKGTERITIKGYFNDWELAPE